MGSEVYAYGEVGFRGLRRCWGWVCRCRWLLYELEVTSTAAKCSECKVRAGWVESQEARHYA